MPAEVTKYFDGVRERGQKAEQEWLALWQQYKQKYSQEAAELDRRLQCKLPQGWKDKLPKYEVGGTALATRKTSEAVLNAIADYIPELVGGSADLTASTLTRWKTAEDFQADGSPLGSYRGRNFRFGVREHGMAAICNGMAAYGALIPFASTFLNFIGYAQGAFRLTALSHLQVVYIMTHDSIGLGEDGPTHQPIEILALLRATPNAVSIRPADGNETNGAYIAALELERKAPTVLCLTRQNLPQLQGSSAEAVLRGAYLLQEHGSKDAPKKLTICGTGSEVPLCVDAAKLLAGKHQVHVRVVSFPSWDLFELQSAEYKRQVFPAGVPVLSVEAYSTYGWERYAHASVGMHSFGASAPAKDVYRKCGMVPDKVAERCEQLLQFYEGKQVPDLLVRPF